MERPPHDIVEFAERVLALIDQGGFTSTYKFAVLIALLDLCAEGADKHGAPPDAVTTQQVANAVIRLYWHQTSPYGQGGQVLEQNTGKEATILRLVREFRAATTPPLSLFEAQRHPGFARLLREVEWTLVLMPLPKLQRFGDQEERFLYEIAWDDRITKSTWRDDAQFDNRIRFAPGAAGNLVRLTALLRPLVLERWARFVAARNALPENELRAFLFETDRAAVARLRGPLTELQGGRCFYCAERLTPMGTQVDHFIPWSRHPDDGVDNLVAADSRCNASKRDFLAGHVHVERWARRFAEESRSLEAIAEGSSWPRGAQRTLALVRSSFLRAPARLRLWGARGEFEAADVGRLRGVLGGL